jgi:hypothetical protein
VAGLAAEACFELRPSNIVMAALDPAIHDEKKKVEAGSDPGLFLRD